ncbi:hypothetical protein D3C87_1334610 [compost metagenome]
MFPLNYPKLDKVRTSRRGVVPTRHLLVSHMGRQCLVAFQTVNAVQHWIANKADRVDFLTQEQVKECTAPVGRFFYDELHEGDVMTMRVVAGISADGGFLLRRQMNHVTSELIGHDVTWVKRSPA